MESTVSVIKLSCSGFNCLLVLDDCSCSHCQFSMLSMFSIVRSTDINFTCVLKLAADRIFHLFKMLFVALHMASTSTDIELDRIAESVNRLLKLSAPDSTYSVNNIREKRAVDGSE